MRQIFSRILHFLIRENIIVSSAVTSLAISTFLIFSLPIKYPPLFSLWGGTILSYSFAKGRTLKYNSVLWWGCAIMVCYNFFFLTLYGKVILLATGLLSIMYNTPLLRRNLRSIPFLKIGIVAICWVSGSIFLPLSEYSTFSYPYTVGLLSLQYFLWICVLILPFDIKDKSSEESYLQTLPTVLGIKKTKIIGTIIIGIFILLAFYHSSIYLLRIQIVTAEITLLSLLFAKEKQSSFYSGFLVESIPIFYFISLYLFYK